jgi:predicted enzyme involved in methoxymalonyl-ACP biosynthesis
MECADKFGSYGIVGFGIVDSRQPLLRDLMFSCRVQGKRVEHAVLAFLLKRFRREGRGDFHAIYRQTAKNAPAGRVFRESGFQPAGDADDRLVFNRGREIPEEGIIELTFSETEELRRNELAPR